MKKWLFLSALFGVLAHAHSPQLSCQLQEQTVHCQGGYSDGSSGFGADIYILDYNDKALFTGRLDEEGRVSFPKPEGEYYVKFDGGPGHVLELDHNDIRP